MNTPVGILLALFLVSMMLGFGVSFGCLTAHFAKRKGFRRAAFWWFGFAAGPVALFVTLFALKSRVTGKRPL